MRPPTLALLAALPAAALADPAADVGAALEQLNAQPNYTWRETQPPIAGVIGDIIWLGRTRTDGTTLLLLLGGYFDPLVVYADGRATIRVRDRWIVASDLPTPFRPDELARRRLGTGSAAADRRSAIDDLLANAGLDAVHQLFASLSWLYSEPDSFLPAIVLGRVHPGLFAWRAEGGALVAEFDERADDLVVRRSSASRLGSRRGHPLAGPRASGTIRFYLEKGALRKLEVTAQTTFGARPATLGEAATRIPSVHQSTRTIEFLDVGTTRVELPPGAAAKLGLATP